MMVLRSHARRRTGGVLLWVAAGLMFVMLGFAALAIDLGHLYATQADLMATAEASSLAGADGVANSADEARLRAHAYAQKNTVEGSPVVLQDADINLGIWDSDTRTFTPDANPPNAVKVTTRRAASDGNPVELGFAKILGFSHADVVATAIAMQAMELGDPILILDPFADCALEVRGSIFLDLPDGAIQVNSASRRAFCASGSRADTNATTMFLQAEDHVMSGNSNFDDIMRRDSPPLPDPLATLPRPVWIGSDDHGGVTSNGGFVLLDPGYYSGGISANGGTITLSPGVYVVDGAGLRLRGNANFIADGVMIHPIGDGIIDMSSSGAVTVTPPDPDRHVFEGADTYAGVSVFQARDNPNEAKITGNSLMDLRGRFYFPVAHLRLGGAGNGFVGNQFIANTMEVHGDGKLTIIYEGLPTHLGPVRLVD